MQLSRLGEREQGIPDEIVNDLRAIGAFGIKIPQEYGGLGLSQRSYVKAMGKVASVDGSLTALLSAHQSIGLPQPLKLFGTKEQKEKYLPRLASGAISAFALTEQGVGSDPARMTTTAELSDDGDAYILNGEKLWTTNGPVDELLVVMASTGRRAGSQRSSSRPIGRAWRSCIALTSWASGASTTV